MHLSPSRWRVHFAVYLALAAGTIALAAALRVPSLFEPPWYADEGIFAAIAHDFRHGRGLYSGAWDNKPPLIFVSYAAVQWAFGTGMLALHTTVTISVLATQAAVIAIGWLLYGPRRALVAALIFAVLLCTPIIEGNLALTETFMILPTSLAVLSYVLAARRPPRDRLPYHVAAGAFIGVAVGFKQVAVFDGAALAFMLWLTEERPARPLAGLAGGFAACQLAIAAPFLAAGTFDDYVYAVAGSIGMYSGLGPEQGPLVRFAGFAPAILASGWLVVRRQHGVVIDAKLFPVLWLGFAVAGAASSSFPFPHYLQQAVPAFALTIVCNPLHRERDEAARLLLGAGAILVVTIVFGQFAFAFENRSQLDPIDYYRTFASHRFGDMSDEEYEAYFDGRVVTVRDISGSMRDDGAGNSLFAWGELPWVYPESGAHNSTRYYASFLAELLPGAREEIIDELTVAPPAYIVISDAAYAPFSELEDLVAVRYVTLRAANDWRLYRLASAQGRLTPQSPAPPSSRGDWR